MVVRKKNLLDAFQASAPEGRIAARRRDDVRASAGGPFAPVRPAPETEAKTALEWPAGARPPAWKRWLGDPAIRVALVAGTLCIAISFWLGRRQVSPVDAGDATSAPPGSGALLRAGTEPTPAPSEAELAKRNLATAQAGSTDDQQFMNPVNKYTVRVKTFSNDSSGQNAARVLHAFFVKENLPVVLPITQGKVCVLYVGHADKKREADLLANYIQHMRGPSSDAKKPAFQDAYVVNIDDVVKR
jgi:hypothetical protein